MSGRMYGLSYGGNSLAYPARMLPALDYSAQVDLLMETAARWERRGCVRAAALAMEAADLYDRGRHAEATAASKAAYAGVGSEAREIGVSLI